MQTNLLLSPKLQLILPDCSVSHQQIQHDSFKYHISCIKLCCLPNPKSSNHKPVWDLIYARRIRINRQKHYYIRSQIHCHRQERFFRHYRVLVLYNEFRKTKKNFTHYSTWKFQSDLKPQHVSQKAHRPECKSCLSYFVFGKTREAVIAAEHFVRVCTFVCVYAGLWAI